MTLGELARLGWAMRVAQRDYFRLRTRESLMIARKLEHDFDIALEDILLEADIMPSDLEYGRDAAGHP